MEKGLIQVYHGDGKGKTTAVVGLSVRAAGNHEAVLFVQFMKDGSSSEISVLKEIPGIEYASIDGPIKFYNRMNDQEKESFNGSQRELFQKIRKKIDHMAIEKGGLVVLDEITYLISYGILSESDVVELLKNKPQNIEIALTGRNPSPQILALADYISCIKCEKHPFFNGVEARKGIEY